MNLFRFLIISVITVNHVFGQNLIFAEPIKLDFAINTTSEEVYPLLNREGTILYFVRTFYKGNVGGKLAGQDIWYTQRGDSGMWGFPENLAELNTSSNNIIVGIGNNDSIVYLQNTYSNPQRWDYGISFSVLKNGNWEKPQELDVKLSSKSALRGYYITPDEDVIVMSSENHDSYGNEDLYLYIKTDDKWSGAVHLDKNINTSGIETSPFLAEDKETLYFASDGHKGFGGLDIFISRRLDETWNNWTDPINLGEVINTSNFEAYFSTYPNGETYFVSNRAGSADIYMTALNIKEPEKKTDDLAQLPVTPPTNPDHTDDENSSTEEVKIDLGVEVGYTVQILAMPRGKKPKNSYFEKTNLVRVNMSEGKDGLDRYYVGEFATLFEAFTEMKSLRNAGYEDAFIRKLEVYSGL